jgi:hypothetical protein
MIPVREVHHKIENKWGGGEKQNKKTKKKHSVGTAYKPNEGHKMVVHHQNT